MTNVHKKLEQFHQWIDIDVNDSPVRNTLKNMYRQEQWPIMMD